jgi:hypothetical protein
MKSTADALQSFSYLVLISLFLTVKLDMEHGLALLSRNGQISNRLDHGRELRLFTGLHVFFDARPADEGLEQLRLAFGRVAVVLFFDDYPTQLRSAR